jgi:putative transposase
VNYKRVERLYQEAKLQVRRRKRKKVPVAGRQPRLRPSAPNEVWSMDFVFDRTADARVIKCLANNAFSLGRAVLAAIEPQRTLDRGGDNFWLSLV